MSIQLLEPFQLFNQEEIDHILASRTDLVPGRVMGYDPQRQTRNNNVFWYSLEPALKDRLWTLALDLKAEYPWTWFQEPVQISRYSQGEYYDWHHDTYDPNGRSSIRSLTLTCTLVPATGAVLALKDREFDLAAGQAVFFDSTTVHKATAPLEGERWAFTVWYMKPSLA